jgi:hypothetical protein
MVRPHCGGIFHTMRSRHRYTTSSAVAAVKYRKI